MPKSSIRVILVNGTFRKVPRHAHCKLCFVWEMSESRQATLIIIQIKWFHMSDEDRKYLRSIKKMRPSLEVFKKMVEILKNVQEQTNQLLQNSLLGKA